MSIRKLRIGFMGTPDFAVPALQALCESEHDVVCVYSQPPRPKGRGHQVQKSPVHTFADEQGIPVLTPINFKSEEARAEFAAHNLDVAVVAAYGLILPEAVLNAPSYGCLNIHASLLPRWRGAAPIQYAIWKGDTETGVTIMQMEKGLDTGPMIAKEALPITQETTAPDLHDDLSALGAQMIAQTVEILAQDGKLEAEPQDDALSTYASMLKKTDGIIDWSQTAQEIDRQIRSLNPWPGVWANMQDKRLKILAAHPSAEIATGQPGQILDKAGRVSSGKGTVLKLLTVQPEGKKPMDFAAVLNGGYLTVGQRLG